MKPYARKLGVILVAPAVATLALVVLFLVTVAHATSPIRIGDPKLDERLITANNAAGSVRADDPRLDDWVITTNFSDSHIFIMNATSDTIYGPFLEGQLGASQNLLDVAITPDGKTALVSNFGDQALYFIDISDPTSPSLGSPLPVSLTLSMFAEDIAITHDGRFALVTDGAFSSMIASVDTLSRTLVYTLNMETGYMTPTHDAQAVAVAPNGTVVYADYFAGEVGTALIDAAGHLAHVGTYSYTIGDHLPWPSNIGIAPDGQTVIVCDAFSSTVGIFQITAPGVLSHTGIVTGLLSEVVSGTSPGVQSVAFNAAGDKAYAVINARFDDLGDPLPDQLAVLDISGPGQVSLDMASAVTLPRATSGQLFGVDVIAVAGRKVYVGHPTISITDTNPLAVVDLADYSVIPLEIGGYPVSVAATPPMRQINVQKAGTGSGTVTSIPEGSGSIIIDPAGIDCGVTCTAIVHYGTVVALTATADTGSSFFGWSGACSGTGACVLGMTETKQITATFNLYRIYLPMLSRDG
jgi:hypothetical protein